jgi:predicted DNA-binding transcriptional regulator YafY
MAKAKSSGKKPTRRAKGTGGAKQKPSYGTTYATASRVTQLALKLLTSGRHLSYGSIRSMAEVERRGEKGPPSERTIERYVKALQAVIRHGDFGTLEVRKHDGGGKSLFFTPKAPPRPAGESLEVLLAVNLLRSLEGTVLRENAKQLLGRIARDAKDGDRYGLQHLPKKFYVVPFGVKHYDDQRALVDALVKALLRQERLDVHYRGLRGPGGVHVHEFEPYTLAIYKGGLYLIGYSFSKERRIYLAVERIERVEPRRTADGEIETFEYPEAYTPEQHTQGAFGIYDTGKAFDVELEILNPETVAFLAPRRFHSTQKMEKRADGTAVMTMRVRALEELVPWVMSMAPWVRVREPAELRERVRKFLAEGVGVYER